MLNLLFPSLLKPHHAKRPDTLPPAPHRPCLSRDSGSAQTPAEKQAAPGAFVPITCF